MQRIALFLLLACCGLLPFTTHASVRVEISGVDSEVEENIRATLTLVRLGERDNLSEAAVRRLHGRVRSETRDAMRPFGFYRPRIESQLQRQGEEWLATVQIDPGEPVLVSGIDVRLVGEGESDERLLAVIAQSPMRVGRRLRHQEHDRLRNNLQSVAARRGYFDASFEQRRLEVDVSERTARVVLHLHTGPRYRFGHVTTDQGILDEALLARIIDIPEGDFYSTGALLRAQYRLTDSLFFASVVVETGTPDPETLTVPIDIQTTPTPRQRIRTGIGYATDTGLRGTLGVDWRRLNKAGHSASTLLRLSEKLSEFSGRYRIPIGDPINERLLFRGSMIYEDLADLESRRLELGVAHVTQRGGGWQRTVYTDLLEERTRTPGAPEFEDLLVLPGISMEKLVADDILLTRRGFRVRGDLRGSQQFLGSSTDFLRLETEANLVRSIGDDWRFFLRSMVGIGLVDGFSTLPASQRFFAGGDNSVRGYSFNSLGPVDENGNVIGGRHLVFGSIEVERRVWNRVALAAFVDAGNALDVFELDLEASAGAAFNIHTPIGTLRLGAARSITESRGWRFHLSIRPDL
ncbi:autotransporter assembly complex family protein [Thioalkalivibrio sp. XN279]|uniref:autotransporter assembly complex protein TamA n=1 Tax=Thioalkalivibrio sp. XN279 TaxID=2714953 RepID=UPI00140DACB6|nr:autotransporter assembly complex family protein [Thioalkalivibrio sp. XN279]NHA15612.1 outer membrane protein assembly factor [Thioalkalivibrio sp. XN279]